jgi:hypothetical protein
VADSPARHRRALARLAPWILPLVFVSLLPAVTTRVNASDEIQFFAWLHSWTFDRDVDFENEYRYFVAAGPGNNPGFVATFLETSNEAGRPPNFAPIGSAVLWLPFYAGGHLAAGLSGGVTDGFSRPYVAAIAYGSAFYGLLALLLSASVARRLVGAHARISTFCVWFGTPLLFYMYVAPVFAHACSAFAVALFLWIWLQVRDRWTIPGVVALSLSAALLPMVREQDAFVVVAPAADFLRWAWRHWQARPAAGLRWQPIAGRAALGVVLGLAAYSPQLLAYRALNGHPGPTVLVARKMSWSSPHFFEVLFSLEHGFFLWTPLALVALGGLVCLAVRGSVPGTWPTGSAAVRPIPPDVRWVAFLLLGVVVLQAYVSGSVESWTVAGAFGQRRFVALTPILAVGMAALLQAASTRVRRAVVAAALVVLVWWNVGLMAQFGLHLMDRQRLTLADNARMTFVDLPARMPSLVARYLFERESFYGLERE